MSNKNETVMIRADIPAKLHSVLAIESALSRKNGKKKNLPEILIARLARDIKRYPVKLNDKVV